MSARHLVYSAIVTDRNASAQCRRLAVTTGEGWVPRDWKNLAAVTGSSTILALSVSDKCQENREAGVKNCSSFSDSYTKQPAKALLQFAPSAPATTGKKTSWVNVPILRSREVQQAFSRACRRRERGARP